MAVSLADDFGNPSVEELWVASTEKDLGKIARWLYGPLHEKKSLELLISWKRQDSAQKFVMTQHWNQMLFRDTCLYCIWGGVGTFPNQYSWLQPIAFASLVSQRLMGLSISAACIIPHQGFQSCPLHGKHSPWLSRGSKHLIDFCHKCWHSEAKDITPFTIFKGSRQSLAKHLRCKRAVSMALD